MDNEKDLSSFINKLHDNAPNTEHAQVQSSQEFDCVSTDKQQRVAFDDSVKMIEDRDRNDRIYELQDDHLKQALEESLQTHNQQTQKSKIDEEQEQLQRAIQLSMMETTSTQISDSIPEQSIKLRDDIESPCGMRNVGSSCWYNTVIQCMFHIPALRRRILSSELRGTSLSTEFDAIRKTFTLLKGSKKSMIETREYVQVFKSHMPSGSTQQDVSEFVHKLLDVCESALKPATENAENPIKKLFYGTLKEIGKTDEHKDFTRDEEFGQCLVDISPDLSELVRSLDGLNEPNIERWFTRLPPVLLFQLKRYTYNTVLKTAQKLNHRIEFPEQLYMDRYEYANRDAARKAFQTRQTIEHNLFENDKAQIKLVNPGGNDVNIQKALNSINLLANEHANGTSKSEMPSGMSADKYRKLVSLLQPWLTHIDDKLSHLKQVASNLRQEKFNLYRKKDFQHHRYLIVGVIVHQGETASSGHYWAFVRDRNEKWWKCNDGDVTHATWNDVMNDSYGGSSGSSSAYSLIYQSQEQFDLDADTPDEELEPDQSDLVEAHDNQTYPKDEKDDVIMTGAFTKANDSMIALPDNTAHYDNQMEIDDPAESLKNFVESLRQSENYTLMKDKLDELAQRQQSQLTNEKNYRLIFSNFCNALKSTKSDDSTRQIKRDLITAAQYCEMDCDKTSSEFYTLEFLKYRLYKETRNMFNHYYYIYSLFMVFDIKWVQEAEGHFINGENFVHEFEQVTEKLTNLSTALKCYKNLTETMSEYEQNYKLIFDQSEEEFDQIIQLVVFLVNRTTNEMCIMLEQMSFEAEKTAFAQMEGYLFCFLFLNKVSEDKQVKSESLRNHLTGTLENIRNKWCSYVGQSDKIQHEEGLRVHLENIFSESQRLSMSIKRIESKDSTVSMQTALMEKLTRFLTEIELENDSMT